MSIGSCEEGAVFSTLNDACIASMTSEQIERCHSAYKDKAYGVFVHYISRYLTHTQHECASVYRDGEMLLSVDEAADAFNAAAFAKSMHEFGAEYVVFTAWHGDTRTLFPSKTNKKWRDDRRKAGSAGKKSYSDRDVIADILDELDKYGIELHLYTHPCDGHDFTDEDRELTGWNDSNGDYAVWNEYINELYSELCLRYGKRIKGLWFDGGYNHVQQQRLKETCTRVNPGMILVGNLAFKEGIVFDKPVHVCAHHLSWEIPQGYNFATERKISRHQSAVVIAGAGWWTTRAITEAWEKLPTAEEMFKYLVAMSSISKGGGFLASTGFYPQRQGEESEDYFMCGIGDLMRRLNSEYIAPVKESIFGTDDSKAYPTPENVSVCELEWGVANESKDGEYIYIHVLNAPEGKSIYLPETADGRFLRSKADIMNFDGSKTAISIEKADGGYVITLPEGKEWNRVDTIIKAKLYQ